jgi:V-type H+-transporting ATPase subunit D
MTDRGSGSGAKLAVFPTRMNLAIIKGRVRSAEKGKTLLKRKSDAIQIRHKDVLSKLDKKRAEVSGLMEKAFFLLAKTEFYGGDLKMAAHEAKKRPLQVRLVNENVSGVYIPKYTLQETEARGLCFMGASGNIIRQCREKFIECLRTLLELATLQSSFLILDEVLKATNRRVNALEHFLIPKLDNTIEYMISELDEQDREDFYRLKKVQSSKKTLPLPCSAESRNERP